MHVCMYVCVYIYRQSETLRYGKAKVPIYTSSKLSFWALAFLHKLKYQFFKSHEKDFDILISITED